MSKTLKKCKDTIEWSNKVIQYLKTEFNKMIKTLKRTLTKIKMALKNSASQLENSRESLINTMAQVEDRLSGLENKKMVWTK